MISIKPGIYFRILSLSILATVLMTGVSLLCLSYFSDYTSREHRSRFLFFLADSIEANTSDLSDETLLKPKGQDKLRWILHRPPRPPDQGPGDTPDVPPLADHHRPPPMPDLFQGNKPRPSRGRGHPRNAGGPPIQFWIFAEDGTQIFAPEFSPEKINWKEIKKPKNFHELAADEDMFRFSPGIYTIKIERSPPIYLVARDDRRAFLGPLFLTQAVLTLMTVLLSLGFSLSLIFFYMRRKSREASLVLRRLEQGDLKARFEIKRFDEFSGLLLDFNRMAAEIERLISHVRDAEKTRTHMMQELGHDLKTPLTALKTSFETLKFHFGKMSEADRQDLLNMMGAEIEYFKELLETLMTMAQLDEPLYKDLTTSLDLSEILNQEIKNRQIKETSHLHWADNTKSSTPLTIKGDAHLILRLFKNALDNASRYAKSEITVEATAENNLVNISVTDDGPGFDEASLQSFGTRSGKRKRREGQELHFSLGLGSFIMKTIVELHGGNIFIENRKAQGKILGAKLIISLPKS
jgi:signal transduction histidine kinase